ncbi:hypothetical protein [Cryptosporangium japonicum]|uniref:hypothetical protein n=1 Tax=Cryptosporangium japonicum TaxID=80872 RepID=UPI0031CF4842
MRTAKRVARVLELVGAMLAVAGAVVITSAVVRGEGSPAVAGLGALAGAATTVGIARVMRANLPR